MIRSMLVLGLLFGVSTARATTIADNFNRADTSESTNTSLIGPHWQQDSSLNTWYIANNILHATSDEVPMALYNDELQTLNGNGNSFELSLDVAGRAASVWSGVAFNYHGPTNFYTVRFKIGHDDYQLLGKKTDGSWNVIMSGHATSSFVADSFYTISVTSDTAYTYDFTITDVASGTLMASEGNELDDESLSTGGYAAAFLSSAGAQFAQYDNFSLETIPEPGTLSLISLASLLVFGSRRHKREQPVLE